MKKFFSSPDIYYLNYSIHHLEEFIDTYIKKKERFAICLIDILNFRFYNYMFGYEYGDILLNMVINKIHNRMNENEYICRFGGDKLLLIISKNHRKDIIYTIEKVIDIFNIPFIIKDKNIKMSISIGISICPDDSKEVATVLKYGEIALNYAKRITKNPYEFFTPVMYEAVIKKEKIQIDIFNAIHNNEFILYYQPQFDMKTMNIYGMEALLRWNHPELGVLSPIYFIDILEHNEMIIEVGKFVLTEACNEIKKWHQRGYDDLSISVNISEKQLQDRSFLSFVQDLLEKTKLESKYIHFEITERILIHPVEKILNVLIGLRNMGIKIFIDDFGTKYSSLNYLYNLPTDGIKIDKSFIDKVQDSEKNLIITKNIIQLANELNLEVVAEGVETDEQLSCLADINCNKIQGFIFGKPVSSDDFIYFLREFNGKQVYSI
jgi:diguanylate cyclase (GGDEF)-like protein